MVISINLAILIISVIYILSIFVQFENTKSNKDFILDNFVISENVQNRNIGKSFMTEIARFFTYTRYT